MGRRKTEKYLFNERLAKINGLYQILNPKSFKFAGYNVYHLIFVILISFVSLVSVMMDVNGLFYWTNHRIEAVFYIGSTEIFLFACYKISIVIYRYRDIQFCLSISRFDFTLYGHHQHASLLKLWRNRIILITNLYAVSCFFAVTLFVSSPILSRNELSLMKSFDSSQGFYRINVLNLYALLSDKTYNAHFNMMYLVEALGLSLFIFFLVVFDTLLITLCLAFSCQLKMINVAFESFRPKRVIEYPIQNNTDVEMVSSIYCSPIDYCMTYNDLKTIIKGHQAVLKKLEIFFSIFQQVTLSQVIVSSCSIINVLLNLATKSIDGILDVDSRVTIMKMIFACPVTIFQLFMICVLFESLHNQKKSVIFALYKSNWTELDMKCKKLILLTMRMNNAHKQTMKFSQLNIVNLEMFFVTMRVCYSVLSMMLNTRSKI